MSTTTLAKWGNSVGVRIPADLVGKANLHIGEKFEVLPNKNGGLLLKPIKDPQEGWLEAFNAIAEEGGDDLLLGEFDNDFDREKWTW